MGERFSWVSENVFICLKSARDVTNDNEKSHTKHENTPGVLLPGFIGAELQRERDNYVLHILMWFIFMGITGVTFQMHSPEN